LGSWCGAKLIKGPKTIAAAQPEDQQKIRFNPYKISILNRVRTYINMIIFIYKFIRGHIKERATGIGVPC
jgi:hypothetical protein